MWSLCINQTDVEGGVDDKCVIVCSCPPAYPYSQCNACFLVKREDLGKTLPTEQHGAWTCVRMDLSWFGHYLQKSSTWKLYKAIQNHLHECHGQALPPLTSHQTRGNVLLACPFIKGKCSPHCAGVICVPADLKPRFYLQHYNACGTLTEYNVHDNDWKGENESERNKNRSKVKNLLKVHEDEYHGRSEQVEPILNTITGGRATSSSTNGSYGQPQQQPTLDATAGWNGYFRYTTGPEDQAADSSGDRAEL
jgi:hypothetical protein